MISAPSDGVINLDSDDINEAGPQPVFRPRDPRLVGAPDFVTLKLKMVSHLPLMASARAVQAIQKTMKFRYDRVGI